MRRFVFAFGLILFLAQMLFAHSVTVDGDISGWNGTPPTEDNSAIVSEGEWVWKDAANDERRNTDYPDNPSLDITEFRVTADTENLYFLIKFRDLALGTTDITYPLVQVAIDYDKTGGMPSFIDQNFTSADDMPQINEEAEWEYLIGIYESVPSTGGVTLPPSSDNYISIYHYDYELKALLMDTVGEYNHHVGSGPAAGFIEAKIPFSKIGGWNKYKEKNIRFSVADFLHNGAWDRNKLGKVKEFESGKCNVMDCISLASDTWQEVKDNRVDFYFDIDFNSNGDVVANHAPSLARTSLKVDDVYCNKEVIVENHNPTFSWGFREPKDVGDFQLACQVKVSSIWDSGPCFTSEPSMIYNGPALFPDTEYTWQARVMDNHGTWSNWQTSKFTTVQPAVTLKEDEINLEIDWNNPFNPKEQVTKIRYSVKEDAYVDIYIYDISGKLVKKLVEDKYAKAGQFYTKEWNGKDDDEEIVGRGIYLVNLRTGEVSKVKRVVVE